MAVLASLFAVVSVTAFAIGTEIVVFLRSCRARAGDTLPCKRFGENIKDEISLSAEGTVGVRKLFNQVVRSTNGVVRLNGRILE